MVVLRMSLHDDQNVRYTMGTSGPVAVLRWGQGAQAPPNLAQAPLNFFQGNLGLTFPHV